jgi:CO/xanthine dehydrogenase FAD-binding subunit
MMRYDYHRPTTLAEALALKAETKGARFIAGGTDLMVRIKDKDVVPPALVSLRSIPEITGICLDDGACIGAATTIGDIVRHAGLAKRYPALIGAARRVGSQQIRNAGTIGGNVCNASPCADTALPLLVHEARVGLASAGGRREIPIGDLFCGPRATCLAADEIMTHVTLPAPSPGAKAVFLKKGRVMMDLSVASVAVLLELDGETCVRARVAAGSVGPIPLRLPEAEKILEGAKITDDILAKACEAAMRGVSPITDVRSTAEYRRHIVGVFLKRAVLGLLGRETA